LTAAKYYVLGLRPDTAGKLARSLRPLAGFGESRKKDGKSRYKKEKVDMR